MKHRIKKTLLIMADISGYTEYTVSTRTDIEHSQKNILALLKAITNRIEPHLRISKIEGDAVFLYAIKGKKGNMQNIGDLLVSLFNRFSKKKEQLISCNRCVCNACINLQSLSIKVIAHSGEALFSKIGEFHELSGLDVILVHRLLKNSVKEPGYILLTEAAFNEIGDQFPFQPKQGKETYSGLGTVKTYIYVVRDEI